MSIEVRNVQRLRVVEEGSSAFAVASTITGGSFLDVPFIEGSCTANLTQNMVDPQHAQQFVDERSQEILGTKGCSLSFSMPLSPVGIEATTGVTGATTTDNSLMTLLKVVMGGLDFGKGSSVASTSQDDIFVVQGGDGVDFAEGGAVAIAPDGKTPLECREIQGISTDTITTKLEFTTAPTDTAYRATTAYLTENPLTSLQFVLEGAEGHDYWRLAGCQGGFTIETTPGEMPKITFNLQGASYTALAERTGALGAATYSNATPVVIQDSTLRVHTVGTATESGSTVHASALTFEPQITYAPIRTPSGTETIHRFRRMRANPVIQGSFTTFYEDRTFYDARDNKTWKSITLQIGDTAGGIVMLSAPRVQIVDVQQTDASGLAGQTVTWRGRHDSDFDGSTAELSRSAFRIHFA